jgi:hypothetical protein
MGQPQLGFGSIGQSAPFGQEFGQMGQSQSGYPPTQFGQGVYGHNPFASNSLAYGPLAQHPHAAQLLQSAFAQRQFSPFQQQAPVHQILPLLGQLTQHAYSQSAITQQIAATLQQLTQIALQAAQAGPAFGQGALTGMTQSGFGGFGPPQQPWGAGLPQTLQ